MSEPKTLPNYPLHLTLSEAESVPDITPVEVTALCLIDIGIMSLGEGRLSRELARILKQRLEALDAIYEVCADHPRDLFSVGS